MGLSPGETLQGGKYTIERRLRVGLTTVSYLAKRSDGSRWVIKVLDPQVLMSLSDDERSRAETLFMQEAVKLVRCSGTPHIVRAEMPFKDGELSCLPVEHISSDSLAERSQPRLKEETALGYIRQLGKALSVVHGQGLVHRDIRPSNIFLRIEGSQVNAVLAGFGLAVDCDTPLTRTRKNELKDGFSPIELYGSGRPVGAYSDVYSLAATLYQLLTGKVPASAEQRMRDADALAFPQGTNAEITETTTKAIVSGMQPQAQDRPQSVADWLAKLEAETDESLEVGGKSAKESKKPIDWGKWGVIWTAVGVLAAVGMWMTDRLNTKPSPMVPVENKPAAVQESSGVSDIEGAEADTNTEDAEP